MNSTLKEDVHSLAGDGRLVISCQLVCKEACFFVLSAGGCLQSFLFYFFCMACSSSLPAIQPIQPTQPTQATTGILRLPQTTFRLSQATSGYLRIFMAISGYLKLSQAISGYLRLSQAISGYPRQCGVAGVFLFYNGGPNV